MIDPGGLLARLRAALWSGAAPRPQPPSAPTGAGPDDLAPRPPSAAALPAPSAAAPAPSPAVVVSLSPAAQGVASGPPLDASSAKMLSNAMSSPASGPPVAPASPAPPSAPSAGIGRWFAGLQVPGLPALPDPEAPAPMSGESSVRAVWSGQSRAGVPRSPERLLRPLLVALGSAGAAAAIAARGQDPDAVARFLLRATRAVEQAVKELAPDQDTERSALLAALEPRVAGDAKRLRAAVLDLLRRMGAPSSALTDPYLLELAVQAERDRVIRLRRRLMWSALMTVVLPVTIVLLAQALGPEK